MTDGEVAGALQLSPSIRFLLLPEPILTSPEVIFTQVKLLCVSVYACVQSPVEVPSGPGTVLKASGLLDASYRGASAKWMRPGPARPKTDIWF